MADNNIEINLPSNLDELKKSLKTLLMIALVLLLLGAGFTSFYTVPADSQGVVTRFGAYLTTVEPGLGFKLPFNIDKVEVVQVRRQLKQEFGFATPGATNQSQYASQRNERQEEKSMVTGDLNAAWVEWSIQYKIGDPVSFLYRVRDPEGSLRDISESVMRTVVGDRTVDEVITVGRQEIDSRAREMMQELVDKYELGLDIELVQLMDVNPPQPVQPSFNEVNQAQQERETMINVANGEYNKVIPRASGEAEQRLQAAEGYALKRVNEAQGDVARFVAVYGEYVKAPEVTKRRLYLETMQEVVPNLGKKIVMDDEAKQILPLLQLNQN